MVAQFAVSTDIGIFLCTLNLTLVSFGLLVYIFILLILDAIVLFSHQNLILFFH